MANTNLDYVVWNSKFRPRENERWRLTDEVIKIDDLSILAVITFNPFIEPARRFIKQRVSLTSLVGYKNAYKASKVVDSSSNVHWTFDIGTYGLDIGLDTYGLDTYGLDIGTYVPRAEPERVVPT